MRSRHDSRPPHQRQRWRGTLRTRVPARAAVASVLNGSRDRRGRRSRRIETSDSRRYVAGRSCGHRAMAAMAPCRRGMARCRYGVAISSWRAHRRAAPRARSPRLQQPPTRQRLWWPSTGDDDGGWLRSRSNSIRWSLR